MDRIQRDMIVLRQEPGRKSLEGIWLELEDVAQFS